ncbi:universal stress protein [Roseobacteraceae bacterium S113]
MYKKILVPMALDHGISPQTLEIAKTLADEGAEILALHVYEPPTGAAAAYVSPDLAENALAQAKARLSDKIAGHAQITGVIIEGHSAREIIQYANTHAVDCIVIGSHKPELSDYFLGSTAARVVRHADCAVHVHRT